MNNILNTLILWTILSSIAALTVIAVKAVSKNKINPVLLSFLWLMVLVRLLVPFSIESPLHLGDIFTRNEANNEIVAHYDNEELFTEYNAPEIYTAYEENVPAAENFNINYPVSEKDSDNLQEPTTLEKIKTFIKSINISALITALWVVGGLWTVFISISQLIVFSIRKEGTSLVSKELLEAFKLAKKKLNIKEGIRIIESDKIDVPIIYGLLSPRILIPAKLAVSIDEDKLTLILMHELMHIKKMDILKNYMWLIAKAIHWFNPLVWIAYKQYIGDMEIMCDYYVAQNLNNDDKAAYTQSLLEATKLMQRNTKYNAPIMLSFCEENTKLRRRIMNILNPVKQSKRQLLAIVIIIVMLVVGCFTTACTKKDDTALINDIGNPEADSENIEVIAETQSPTSTVSLDSDNNPVSQPIKRSPLGSQEAAIAVAESINISNADEFTYVTSYERGVMKVHDVKADGDIFADYHIYDFNGEIRMLQTSALCTKELGEELSADELKQKVIDFAMLIYPNTTLNITDCVKDNSTWEIEGVEYQSKDYIVTGRLVDSEDNSVRSFTSKVRLDGCVRYVEAEYNGMDFLGMTDEVKNKILSYAESEEAEIDIFQIDDYYGDNTLHFTLGKQMGTVTLLASDMSLVDYLNIPNQTDVEFNLSNSEVDELVQQYADYYFPGNTGVIITDGEVIDNDYVGIGTITDSRGEMYFYIQLNGDGKIHKIGIKPNVDKESLTKVEKSAALQTAIQTVIEECGFADQNRLEILSENEYSDEYVQAYKFDFKYTSLNPSIYDYSFNAYVDVNVYSGEPCSLRIEYIEDGLDLISEEEAIAKAKEYITAEYDVDPNKLIFKEFIVMAHNILEFQVNFDYENGNSYGASMLADTGERDGVGWGSNN